MILKEQDIQNVDISASSPTMKKLQVLKKKFNPEQSYSWPNVCFKVNH